MISIDIILFCYNQEQYIEQALKSIYEQKLPKNASARIVVADDASTDHTLAIIKRLAPESPFPIVFLPEEPNMGISKNYKRSFAAATAEYVAILEGDDYWLPNHLIQHLRFLKWHPIYVLSINQLQFLQEGEGMQESCWPFFVPYISISMHQQIECGNQLGNMSACVIRGKYLRKLPDSFFELSFADWELGMFVAQYGPMAKLREVTSIYRVKPSGQWVRLNDNERMASRLATIDAMDDFFDRKYHTSFLIVRDRVEHREKFSYIRWPKISLFIIHIRRLIKKGKHIIYIP